MKKIIVTGGSGRFGKILKKTPNNYNILYPSKSVMDITKPKKLRNILKNKNLKSLYIWLVYLDQWKFIVKISPKVLS